MLLLCFVKLRRSILPIPYFILTVILTYFEMDSVGHLLCVPKTRSHSTSSQISDFVDVVQRGRGVLSTRFLPWGNHCFVYFSAHKREVSRGSKQDTISILPSYWRETIFCLLSPWDGALGDDQTFCVKRMSELWHDAPERWCTTFSWYFYVLRLSADQIYSISRAEDLVSFTCF